MSKRIKLGMEYEYMKVKNQKIKKKELYQRIKLGTNE